MILGVQDNSVEMVLMGRGIKSILSLLGDRVDEAARVQVNKRLLYIIISYTFQLQFHLVSSSICFLLPSLFSYLEQSASQLLRPSSTTYCSVHPRARALTTDTSTPSGQTTPTSTITTARADNTTSHGRREETLSWEKAGIRAVQGIS